MSVQLQNRRRERRSVDHPVRIVRLHPGGPCLVVDASPAGVQIETGYRMLPNSACVVHWSGSFGTRRAAARVRWAALVGVDAESAPVFRSGLEFLDGRTSGWVATTQ